MYIQGLQINLPGQQSVGPYSIPASGTQQVVQAVLVASTVTVTVPTVAAGYPESATGALIIPPTGGTVAWSYKTTSGDTGIHGSPLYPSVLSFDPANMPTTLYLVSTGTVTLTVQFL